MGFAEKPVVGVAVVSYRSPGRTCAFVSRELPKLPFAYETCVVDVASTPETRRGLEEGLPSGVHRLFFEENLGYSRGNNAAARLLREKLPGMKYLLVCNDDILFDGDSHLERLLDFLESHPECGIAGPSVRGVDGAEQSPWNCADDLGARERWFRRVASPFGGDARECYAVRGCLLLVRAEPFFRLDGFDEEFFLFFEEPVLGERFRRAGQTTWYIPGASATHLGSATIRKALSSWRIYRLYRRSFFLVARKYWGWSWLSRATWPFRHLLSRLTRSLFGR